MDLSNKIFNTKDTEQLKDNMRCAAYISETIAQELYDEMNQYKSLTDVQQKENRARTISYLYSALIESRLQGEKALQKMFESMDDKWLWTAKSQPVYKFSLQVTQTLEIKKECANAPKQEDFIISEVSCPVDVAIYDSKGNQCLTLKDGAVTEGQQNNLYWKAVKSPFSNDYIKIAAVPNNSGYTVKCIGNDLGVVDYSGLSITNEGKGVVRQASNIPVKKNDVIEISNISDQNSRCRLIESDSTSKDINLVEKTDKVIDVKTMTLNEKSLDLAAGDKKLLIPSFQPANASIQSVKWSSSDESVAIVNANGVVEGIGGGKAVIQAEVENGSNLKAECAVNVRANKGSSTSTSVTSNSNSAKAVKPAKQDQPKQDMYRLYNPNSGEHFFTASRGERNHLVKLGWRDEGIGWTAPKSGTPVYRLYNKNGGEHHYTTRASERRNLIKHGWKDEGIGWYSGGSVPLYRQYNPNAFANNHNYTKSTGEKNHLIRIGWKDEGIAWYGVA